MTLSPSQYQLIESDYLIAQRIRFFIAQLFGFKVQFELRDLLLQCTEEERALLIAIQHQFAHSKGQSAELASLAQKGYSEFRKIEAYEAGRAYAASLPAFQLIHAHQSLKHQANPYDQSSDGEPGAESLAVEWDEGFQNYLEMTREESW